MVIAVSWSGQRIERRTSGRTGKSRAGRPRGLPRVAAVAVMALFALSILAAPAAAASTYDWSISCKGDAAGDATWRWTQDGATIGSGFVRCLGDEVAGETAAARPDGANGIDVSVLAAGRCSELHFKTVSKSFSVDGSFKVNIHVQASENNDGPSCSGRSHQRVAFTISG